MHIACARTMLDSLMARPEGNDVVYQYNLGLRSGRWPDDPCPGPQDGRPPQDLLAKAQAALAAGDDYRAFEFDCVAMDIETDLINFGFANLI